MLTLMRVTVALALTWLLYLFMTPWFEQVDQVGSVLGMSLFFWEVRAHQIADALAVSISGPSEAVGDRPLRAERTAILGEVALDTPEFGPAAWWRAVNTRGDEDWNLAAAMCWVWFGEPFGEEGPTT